MTGSTTSPCRLSIVVTLPNGERYPFHLDGSRFTIGRRACCDLQLPSPAVSGTHARFELAGLGGQVQVTDLGSKNGTFLAGYRLPPNRPVRLPPDAEISIADCGLLVRSILEPDPFGLCWDALEQSRSLSRVFLCGLIGQALERSKAVLEVIKGPAKGRRLTIAPDRVQVTVGVGPGVDLDLADPALKGEPVIIHLVGEGYLLASHPVWKLKVGREPVRADRLLRSGDKLSIRRSAIRFTDPLQSLLDEISAPDDEGEGGERPTSSGRTSGSQPTPAAGENGSLRGSSLGLVEAHRNGESPKKPASPVMRSKDGGQAETPGGGRRWQPLEILLLGFAVLAVLLGLALLVVLWVVVD
ncbi:MAG: FHA domain-containing protein [Bradymonadales bacterium]|nr:FHA domain-containing protein [Bradymonadales bacterium]